MVRIKINNQEIMVAQGTTVLESAEQLKIKIPTLCYLKKFEKYTSCMICVVEDKITGKLIPACSVPVSEEMEIETENERINEARKDTLDLLLSEHVGDCEAPCHRICPAYMNIPLMIRQIREKNFDAAIRTVKKDIALPAILGRICPAPCENGCNRKYHDNSVSICALKRYVADEDLRQESPYQPALNKKSGKKIAIVGAGPTGLSAAYYLLQDGHSCFIFDNNEKPGGQLRFGVAEDKLPANILDNEIYQIERIGAKFEMNKELGRDFFLKDLKNKYDAIVLAIGTVKSEFLKDDGIHYSSRGIIINRKTFQTDVAGIFAGGNALTEGKMAIRSAAHGKFIAFSVNQFLKGEIVTGPPQQFNSMMGKLRQGEVVEFLQEVGTSDRIEAMSGYERGYLESEAVNEATRCFHCDCRKPVSCKLRMYSQAYNASQSRFKTGERGEFKKIIQHELVIYEPGKCIKCGLCVRIAEQAGEELGLTFIKRGFNVRIAVPFNDSLEKGLKKVARECAEACPTAALAMKNSEELKTFS